MTSKLLSALVLFVCFARAFAAETPSTSSTAIVGMAPASAGLPALPAVVRNETQEQQDARLRWFREARFGLFIHWGVYAVPAGKWKDRQGAEWIMNQAKIPVADYRALANDFTAAKYDPEFWAQLAAEAGMKYIVITTKHHDGFTLFDSAYSDWNAVKSSGAKRDLIAPLAAATRRRGMKFGTYYSQSQDWVNLGGGKGRDQPWDELQKQGDFDTYLKTIALPQTRELLEKFNPDILWWDTEYQMTPERARPFFDLVLSRPHLIHNSRLGGGVLGDFRTSEQRIPASAMRGRALEVNMTMNRSWGYRADDLEYKSAQQLIRNISDIASKDGNYLLNVSPTAEGEIPAPQIERLRAIGRWMKVNGAAIYATRGGLYGKPLDWGRTSYQRAPDGATTLYLHVWNWPAYGKILLPGVTQLPRAGRVLVGGAAVTAIVAGDSLVLTLPGAAPDPDASVVVLEFARPVEVAGEEPMGNDTGASGTLADPSKSPPSK